MYMEFVSPENAKKNIIILPKKTKKKKIVKRKPSRKYVLLPPRMLNLPKAVKQPTMIHYHYLSGFGRPSSLNEAQQPSFHAGDADRDEFITPYKVKEEDVEEEFGLVSPNKKIY